MNQQHKYVTGSNGSYGLIFCELCGLVVFNGIDSKDDIAKKEKERLATPLCPAQKPKEKGE